jgi:hypothetical protein
MMRIAGLVLSLTWLAQPQPQGPLQRLEASIQRTTRSVNATWGVYVKSIGHHFAQFCQGADPDLFHAIDRTAHTLGDLGKGQVFQMTQHQHFAIVLRERFQGVG